MTKNIEIKHEVKFEGTSNAVFNNAYVNLRTNVLNKINTTLNKNLTTQDIHMRNQFTTIYGLNNYGDYIPLASDSIYDLKKLYRIAIKGGFTQFKLTFDAMVRKP